MMDAKKKLHAIVASAVLLMGVGASAHWLGASEGGTLKLKVGLAHYSRGGDGLNVVNENDFTLTNVRIKVNRSYSYIGSCSIGSHQQQEVALMLEKFRDDEGKSFGPINPGIRLIEVESDQGSWWGHLTLK